MENLPSAATRQASTVAPRTRAVRAADWAANQTPPSPIAKLANRVRDFSARGFSVLSQTTAWRTFQEKLQDKYHKFSKLSKLAQTTAMLTALVILASISSIPYGRGARFGIHRTTLLHRWNEEHAFAWWERQAPFVVGEQKAQGRPVAVPCFPY